MALSSLYEIAFWPKTILDVSGITILAAFTAMFANRFRWRCCAICCGLLAMTIFALWILNQNQRGAGVGLSLRRVTATARPNVSPFLKGSFFEYSAGISATNGGLSLEWLQQSEAVKSNVPDDLLVLRWSLGNLSTSAGNVRVFFNRWGFRLTGENIATGFGYLSRWQIIFPDWLPVIAFSAATILCWQFNKAMKSRRLWAEGRCIKCGFDLRAHKTGDKCPECGTAKVDAKALASLKSLTQSPPP